MPYPARLRRTPATNSQTCCRPARIPMLQNACQTTAEDSAKPLMPPSSAIAATRPCSHQRFQGFMARVSWSDQPVGKCRSARRLRVMKEQDVGATTSKRSP